MLSPKEVAERYVSIGKGKAALPVGRMLALGMLAGAFIALAAVGANTALSTVENPSLGKLASACVFPGGLAMVLLAGSELFTGNCLLVIPLLQKEIGWGGMLRNWFFVYLGNLLGSLLIVALAAGGGQWGLFSGQLAVTTIKVAAAKVGLSFPAAFCLGVCCNFLVCIAVWISFAADSVAGKLAGLFFPIMLFVLSGFEHSVANMYYIPAGLAAAADPGFAAQAAAAGVDMSGLTWGAFFLRNLLPVTLGNIVGGSVLVGCVYWYCYLRKNK
ncbi:MAG: formate/nitrite transporter family protein [Firmicutes bacterium]|nr:formate/nitrite transporter family protein [Bacillota bacterium]